jgi:CheY-like chemotaxis protein
LQTDILIIDDNISHLETVTEYFGYNGYHVTTLSDPREAISAIKEKKPKVILLDIMMPFMDGLTLLKKIKETDGIKSIPVIVLSGKIFPPEMKKAISLGAERYLTKPVKSADLLNLVKEYL